MNNEQEMDRSWEFNLNVSGVAAPTGFKAMEVPEGYYKVMISDCYVNPERNANRVVFKVTISDGTFTGQIRTTGMNKPTGPDDGVRHYWRGALESCGYTAAQLDAGQIAIAPASFMNRPAFMYYAPKGHNGSQWEKVEFLTDVDFAQKLQAHLAKSTPAPTGQVGSVLGGNGMGTAPTTTSKNDVLAKLGLNAK
jgi:hypothetical protein